MIEKIVRKKKQLIWESKLYQLHPYQVDPPNNMLNLLVCELTIQIEVTVEKVKQDKEHKKVDKHLGQQNLPEARTNPHLNTRIKALCRHKLELQWQSRL